MKTYSSENKLISLSIYSLLFVFALVSTNVRAEYYYVATTPTPYPCQAAPCKVYTPCRVYKPVPRCHYKKLVKRHHYCKRPKAYRPSYTCAIPKRPSHYQIEVYYAMPSCVGPCGTTYIAAPLVMESGFVVSNGPPIYSPNTYHPDINWDMRTADDY